MSWGVDVSKWLDFLRFLTLFRSKRERDSFVIKESARSYGSIERSLLLRKDKPRSDDGLSDCQRYVRSTLSVSWDLHGRMSVLRSYLMAWSKQQQARSLTFSSIERSLLLRTNRIAQAMAISILARVAVAVVNEVNTMATAMRCDASTILKVKSSRSTYVK